MAPRRRQVHAPGNNLGNIGTHFTLSLVVVSPIVLFDNPTSDVPSDYKRNSLKKNGKAELRFFPVLSWYEKLRKYTKGRLKSPG